MMNSFVKLISIKLKKHYKILYPTRKINDTNFSLTCFYTSYRLRINKGHYAMDVCYKYEMKTVTCMYCTMLTTGLCCTCAWYLVLVNITVICSKLR